MKERMCLGIVLMLFVVLAIPAGAQTMDSGGTFPTNTGGGGTPPGEGGSGTPLTTIFASDNSFCGNMFDLEATIEATVVGWEVNVGDADGNAGGSTEIFVYYRLGTSVGNEGSSAGWTLLGTDTVTAAGIDTPTPVDIGGLVMDPGQVYGIYVTVDETTCNTTALMFYTNGADTYTDGTLTLTTHSGNGTPHFNPDDVFVPRIWNGTVYYVQGVPTVPYEAIIILVALLSIISLTVLRRRRLSSRS